MSDTNGFSQEQLIVFKLGQIESTLEAIQAQLAVNDARDITERKTLHDRLDLHDQEIKELQRHKNYSLGIVAVITALFAAKDIIFKWLNFH